MNITKPINIEKKIKEIKEINNQWLITNNTIEITEHNQCGCCC